MSDEILGGALAAIGRKERTVAEMRQWLADREVDPGECERVIGYLTENLALDDERFARAFTADKRELSGWGNERIERTLLGRGIPSHLVQSALEQEDGEGEVERGARLLGEKGVDLSDDRGRSRALGMLARRGYGAEEAYAAIRRARPAA